MERIHDIFAHLGVAIALHYSAQTLANVYKVGINFPLQLPPYPGNRIILAQSGLVH